MNAQLFGVFLDREQAFFDQEIREALRVGRAGIDADTQMLDGVGDDAVIGEALLGHLEADGGLNAVNGGFVWQA